MKQFIYTMLGDVNAPAGDGETRGWFFYYKWDRGEEVWLPVSVIHDGFAEPESGDKLWFVMDGLVLGCVTVLRTERDELNARYEIWYSTDAIQRTCEPLHLALPPPLPMDLAVPRLILVGEHSQTAVRLSEIQQVLDAGPPPTNS